MQRLVIGQPGKIRFYLEDDEGEPLEVEDAAIEVRDPDGLLVFGPSTASGTDVYATVWQPQRLGVFTATLSGTLGGDPYSTELEVRVVGFRSVRVSVLRSMEGLSDLEPADVIRHLDAAEEAMEEALGFRIATTVERMSARVGRDSMRLITGGTEVQGVESVLRNGSSVDVSTVTLDGDSLELPTVASWGFLTGTTTNSWLAGDYQLDLRVGLPAPDGQIGDAIVVLARHYADRASASQHGDRTMKMQSADTEIWFSAGGPDNPFGLPEVDSVVTARRVRPVVARGMRF